MHILFLTPGFPKDENDFLCIPPFQDYLLKLKEQHPKLEINIIAFQYPYRAGNYNWNNIDVTSLNGKNRLLKKFSVWHRGKKEVFRIHKLNKIDVIHSLWLGECALLGNYIAKKINAKHFCTLMGQDVTKNNFYLRLINLNKLSVVSLSDNQSKHYLSLTDQYPNQEIYWGIQNFQYDQNQKREIDLLAVGSLISIKNYSLFIRSVAEIVKYNNKLKCVIIGDGPERKYLENLTFELGVKNNIEFKGLKSRKEIFTFMQMSKVFVHPSKFEGSGFVFAEALSNGMTIISFNVGYAAQNKKWVVAKDDTDFIFQTSELLKKDLDHEPLNLFPINETVNRYSKLYGLIN